MTFAVPCGLSISKDADINLLRIEKPREGDESGLEEKRPIELDSDELFDYGV